MRRRIYIGALIMVLLSLILVPADRTEAMNNESAALLAGAIALFGKPIIAAVTQDIICSPPGIRVKCIPPSRATYRKIYITPEDSCYRPCEKIRSAYERGWCDEMRRLMKEAYDRGRRDARWYYYEYIDP